MFNSLLIFDLFSSLVGDHFAQLKISTKIPDEFSLDVFLDEIESLLILIFIFKIFLSFFKFEIYHISVKISLISTILNDFIFCFISPIQKAWIDSEFCFWFCMQIYVYKFTISLLNNETLWSVKSRVTIVCVRIFSSLANVY